MSAISFCLAFSASVYLGISASTFWGGFFGGVISIYVCVLATLFLQQRKSGATPPSHLRWMIPGVGDLFAMIFNTHSFWKELGEGRKKGATWTSFLSQSVLFVKDVEMSRKILMQNGKFQMALHPNATRILGKHNIAFLHGHEHFRIRKAFLVLFSPALLDRFKDLQREVMLHYLQTDGWETDSVGKVREMNQEISQRVFLGNYLADPQAFSSDYKLMTLGFLSLPLYLPGTNLWNAVKARERIIAQILTAIRKAAAEVVAEGTERNNDNNENGSSSNGLSVDDIKAKASLHSSLSSPDSNEQTSSSSSSPAANENGNTTTTNAPPPPPCMLREWVRNSRSAGLSEEETAGTLMDFLFASQDASSASLAWVFKVLSTRPNVYEAFRAKADDEKEMKQLACEILRYRPPAPMVPQVATTDVDLGGGIVASKGTLTIPSITEGMKQVGGEEFSPFRDPTEYTKDWIVFGVGPHSCVGYRYAIQHLAMFISCVLKKWESIRPAPTLEAKNNKGEDWYTYGPTVYPTDCFYEFVAK